MAYQKLKCSLSSLDCFACADGFKKALSKKKVVWSLFYNNNKQATDAASLCDALQVAQLVCFMLGNGVLFYLSGERK